MTFFDEMKKGITCDSAGKPDSVLGRAVCISVHPGKMVLFPFLHWFEKRYKHRYKFARLVFSFDLILIGVMLALIGVAFFFTFYTSSSFEDDIHFSATVAPREVVAGAPSTLVMRYTNETEEELRNIHLSFEYPDHFLLQEITHEGEIIQAEEIFIESLPIGEGGSVRIRGVMFGNVGGEQTFGSEMSFVYGTEEDMAGRKTDNFTFSPASSTLDLELVLPERLVAFQNVEGTLRYHNTGEIDFPVISVEPEWPEGFSFLTSDASLVNNRFELPSILAGESGEMSFSGYLGEVGEEVVFVMHPYFTFDTTQYRQNVLTHIAPVIPPQLSVTHSMEKTSLVPGSRIDVVITYVNTGNTVVSDVVLGFESESPFLSEGSYVVGASDHQELEEVEPGKSGSVTVSADLRSWISQSETDTYENLQLTTHALAEYTLGDGTGQRVTSGGSELSLPLTTPVVLESFARYTTASGDQLGRGPLPPRVGIETKYWIFWHLTGTTNDIENLHIEAKLPDNVTFTGRQTVSTNAAVEYDEATKTVSWGSSLIEPTLSPSSKVVGMAFEVGITPTEDQIGTEPVLVQDIFLSGTDGVTGMFLSRYSADITTNLPSDSTADGKSIVE